MWLSTISKCALLSSTCNNGLPLHFCQSTKYSVLLLATECIKRYECGCLYACVSVRMLVWVYVFFCGCLYACVSVCMLVWVSVYLYLYACKYLCACVSVRMLVWVYVFFCGCLCAYVSVCMLVWVSVCLYLHACVYLCACVSVCMLVYLYACVSVCFCDCMLVWVSVNLCECLYTWPTQPAHKPHSNITTVACLAVPHFATLSHKRQDFRKKLTEHNIRVSIPATTFPETFLIPSRFLYYIASY